MTQRLNPSLSDTTLLSLRYNSNSGYGVFATQNINSGSHLLTSDNPATFVINRAYRKEVCGFCFKYDNGRNWKVKIDEGMPNVFCSDECKFSWLEEYQDLGKEAYSALETFIRKNARKDLNSDVKMEEKSRFSPSKQEVENTWERTTLQGELIRSFRMKGLGKSEDIDSQSKSSEKAQKRAYASASSIHISDVDNLYFLLSGVLCAASTSQPSKWQGLLTLNPCPVYESFTLLHELTSMYLIFLAILPYSLLPFVTRDTFEVVSLRDVGNSFGIWEGDGEMLGYGTWVSGSFFNHSCMPNVSKDRIGRKWFFSTSVDVVQGTEMCISYLGGKEKELNVKQRRERLKNGWSFICHCSLCLKETREQEGGNYK